MLMFSEVLDPGAIPSNAINMLQNMLGSCSMMFLMPVKPCDVLPVVREKSNRTFLKIGNPCFDELHTKSRKH
jgi:hypothetical protein